MGKKKNRDDDDMGDDEAGDEESLAEAADPGPPDPETPAPSARRRGLMPALSVGDILALVALIVLSAALLLEGYHKDFRDYSKEIVALFAVVVGFILGRKI